jgi:hypothetical protein
MRTLLRISLSNQFWIGLTALLLILIVMPSSVAFASLQASAATPRSVTLTWTAPGDDGDAGTAAQYDLRYSLLPITSANWQDATPVAGMPVPQSAGSAETYTIDNLAAGTLYHFAIRAADEALNWSEISNVASLSTAQESDPPANIADLLAGNPTSSGVTLTWTAPGDDADTGTASLYDIRYSTSVITSVNWSSATQLTGEPTPSAAGTAESFNVTNLAPNTIYYFAIITADEVPNWSGLSNVAGVTTGLEQVAPGDIVNFAATGVSDTSITLSWTAPGDDGDQGTASVYDIRYSTAPMSASVWNLAIQVTGEPSPQPAGSNESITIYNLQAGTSYNFAMMTADEASNWSGMSNIVNVSTAFEGDPPNDIADLAVTGTTGFTAMISWTAPGDDGDQGTAGAYDIRFATAPITVSNWTSATQVTGEPQPAAAGSVEAFEVNSLQPNTTYYFAIRTADEVPNWSGLSNVASGATTDEDRPPSDIANLMAGLFTDSSITLGWTAPGDDGDSGTAALYDIRYATAPITMANWSAATPVADIPVPNAAGTVESLTVRGLDTQTTYYFAIRTADEVPNWSGLSNVATGNTVSDVTPPAAINDLDAAPGETAGEIDLTWTAPGDDGWMGSASLYVIKYSDRVLTETNWDSATVFEAPPGCLEAGQMQTSTIGGLNPGQHYYLGLKAVDKNLNVSGISNVAETEAHINLVLDVDDVLADLPEEFALVQNYPNPFNPTTSIGYSVPTASHVNISVYNINGRQTATLVNETKSPGSYTAEWDGTSDSKMPVASGVYLYRIQTDSYSESKKMVLLK